MKDLIKAVRQHALDNYEHDGWDFVVECWSDEEIEAVLAEWHCTTEKHAIEAMARIVSAQDEQRKVATSEIF